MDKKNILHHLKEQAQKAGQKVSKMAKEIADDSGLSTKEGREELLKRTKELANKTKESIQETAIRGASAAKKKVNKSIETVQKKGNQLKEAINKRIERDVGVNSKEEINNENSLVTKPNKTNHSERSHQNKQKHTTTIVSTITGIAIATAGITSGLYNTKSPSKNTIHYKPSSEHCAIYSLEEEYNMMTDCIYKNKYQHSNVVGYCADHIKTSACNTQKERNQSGYSTKTYQQNVETHCAFFSLEQEYHLMNICVESCDGNTSRCSEEIRLFECSERNTYDEAERKAQSCPIRDNNYYYR